MLGETREGIGAQRDLLAFCHPALGPSATRPPSKHRTNAPDWHTSRLLRPEFAAFRLGRTARPGARSRGLPDSHSTPWRWRQSPEQRPLTSLVGVGDLRTPLSGHHVRDRKSV